MPRTHEVTNQAPPLTERDVSAYPALNEAVHRHGAGWAEPELRELGEWAGGEQAQEWGRLAKAHPPVLRTHDRYGNRIDVVEFHPHWHDLMRTPPSRTACTPPPGTRTRPGCTWHARPSCSSTVMRMPVTCARCP